MNLFQILFCTTILLISDEALSGVTNHSAPKSMSRGFSSNRPTPSVSAPRPKASTSFGSFGGTRQGAMPAPSSSIGHRDLANSQAQQQAMKNWNARQPQKSVGDTNAMGNPIQSNRMDNANRNSASTHSNPMPANNAPIVVQSGGSNIGGILTGVLIGQALSQPRNANANGSLGNSNGNVNPVTSDGEFKQSRINNGEVEGRSADVNSHAQDKEGSSLFGWVFIFGVIGLLALVIRRKIGQTRQQQLNADKTIHYTLGKV